MSIDDAWLYDVDKFIDEDGGCINIRDGKRGCYITYDYGIEP